MTAAFIHTCNKCQQPFLKEDGCNKMTCPCGNYQCYVCRQSVVNYNHFGPGKCQLYEDTTHRQRNRVADAQTNAIRDVRGQRSDVTKHDLTVDKDLIVERDELEQNTQQNVLPEAMELDHRLQDIDELRPEELVEIMRQFQRLELEERDEIEALEQELEELELGRHIMDEENQMQEGVQDEREQPGEELRGEDDLERQEREQAIALVMEFETQEASRRERAATETERGRIIREDQYERQAVNVEIGHYDWELFLNHSRQVFRPREEEQMISRTRPPAEVEVYWAQRIQNLQSFIKAASQLIALNEKRYAENKLSTESRRRFIMACSLLQQAEAERTRFRLEGIEQGALAKPKANWVVNRAHRNGTKQTQQKGMKFFKSISKRA